MAFYTQKTWHSQARQGFDPCRNFRELVPVEEELLEIGPRLEHAIRDRRELVSVEEQLPEAGKAPERFWKRGEATVAQREREDDSILLVDFEGDTVRKELSHARW